MPNVFNFNAVAADDGRGGMPADAELMAEMLEPRLVERPAPCPPIRVPRSARRTYSHGELCLAANLLETLRRRAELPAPPPRGCDADHVLDVVADRLLGLL